MDKITGIVNLKDKRKISENHYCQHWHVYFTNCQNFAETPKGVLIEENIIQGIPMYKVMPFGFIPEGKGYLSINTTTSAKSNSLTEQFNQFKNLTDIEIEQLLYSWKGV